MDPYRLPLSIVFIDWSTFTGSIDWSTFITTFDHLVICNTKEETLQRNEEENVQGTLMVFVEGQCYIGYIIYEPIQAVFIN